MLTVDKDGEIPIYDAYDKVIDQMHGFVEQIQDLDVSIQMKFDMLIMVFQQHAFLIRHRKKGYLAGGFDYCGIMKRMSEEMRLELQSMNLPLQTKDLETVYEFIDSITINVKEV